MNVVRTRFGGNKTSVSQTGLSSGDEYRASRYWTQAVVSNSQNNGDSTARGYNSDSYGTAFGMEYDLDHSYTTLGAFAGITRSDTDIDGLSDESSVNNYQFGLYGAHHFDGSNFRMNGTLSASVLDFDTSRLTGLGKANADFDGYGGYATAELAYDMASDGGYKISPYVGLEASFIHRDGYSESGAGILNIDVEDETNEYLTTVIGVETRGEYTTDSGAYNITPSARIGWAHQYLDDSSSSVSSFSSAPSIAFETNGPERERDSVRVGFDVEITSTVDSGWTTFVRYDGDYTSGAQDHMLLVGAGLKF